MIYTEQLKKDISELGSMLNNIIDSAESQGALNLDVAYSLRSGLKELLVNIENNTELDIVFIKKWNRLVAYCSRFFEGHPILDSLDSIDKKIIPENLRLLT